MKNPSVRILVFTAGLLAGIASEAFCQNSNRDIEKPVEQSIAIRQKTRKEDETWRAKKETLTAQLEALEQTRAQLQAQRDVFAGDALVDIFRLGRLSLFYLTLDRGRAWLMAGYAAWRMNDTAGAKMPLPGRPGMRPKKSGPSRPGTTGGSVRAVSRLWERFCIGDLFSQAGKEPRTMADWNRLFPGFAPGKVPEAFARPEVLPYASGAKPYPLIPSRAGFWLEDENRHGIRWENVAVNYPFFMVFPKQARCRRVLALQLV